MEETHAEDRVRSETFVPAEEDENSLASRLNEMTFELRKLSNQVAEIQGQLSPVLEQRGAVPLSNQEQKPREITFREFLGAIWW